MEYGVWSMNQGYSQNSHVVHTAVITFNGHVGSVARQKSLYTKNNITTITKSRLFRALMVSNLIKNKCDRSQITNTLA